MYTPDFTLSAGLFSVRKNTKRNRGGGKCKEDYKIGMVMRNTESSTIVGCRKEPYKRGPAWSALKIHPYFFPKIKLISFH